MPDPLRFGVECIICKVCSRPDGLGGRTTIRSDGEVFRALIGVSSSTERKRAEQDGISVSCQIMVKKELELKAGDYCRRLSDGQIFRVTSDPDDRKVPDHSALGVKLCTAEKSVLPE